jgi:hypothetical protein
LLDSSLFGYGTLSVDRDSSRCFFSEFLAITEDGIRSNIVMYDLRSRRKTLLHSGITANGPELSQRSLYVAYADFGDLYVFDLSRMREELVFQRGGSYSYGQCSTRLITQMHWSTSGEDLCVFKYSDLGKGTYELYEVTRLPAEGR